MYVEDPTETLTRNVEHLVAFRGELAEAQLRQEWEMEDILAERGEESHKEYLLCWRGYGPEHDLRVPQQQIQVVQLLLEALNEPSAQERARR